MAHSQEPAQLHEDLKEAKAKWAELHDTVTGAAERESAFMEKVNNEESNLYSKTEDANVAEEKRDKIEERLKRVMEQNQLHETTNVELYYRISLVKTKNDKLQTKIEKLQAKLQDKEDSILLDKIYATYHMKRKTLEEAKEGIANIDDCIAKARELETTALENLPTRPISSDSSNLISEYSGREKQVEKEENKDEGFEPEAEQPSPEKESEDSLLPSGFGSKNN
ncbi:tropomyosin-2-like [Nicotiana tomentosiformis]|uniref:tropomyosin-2-like n=1 Tax=Nicotiana tomentosiformis TaxID=4098 RepID=UPI00388C9AD9